jgi:hypothetical protein
MGESLTALLFPLSALLATAVAVCAMRGASGKLRMHPVLVVFTGGGLAWIFTLVLGIVAGIVNDNPESARAAIAAWVLNQAPLQRAYWWAAAGVQWLLLWVILRDIKLNTWLRRIVAMAAVYAADIVNSLLFTGLSVALFGSLRNALPGWYPGPTRTPGLAVIPFGLGIGFVALKIWLVTRWLGPQTRQWREPDIVVAVGLKGVIMSKLHHQSTRLLCASVLLNHGSARSTLLKWLNDKNRAVALELGLDVRLAAQVARFAEKRQRRNGWIYFAISCAGLLGWIASIAALPLAGLAAAIFWFVQHKKERDVYAPMFWSGQFDPEKVRNYFAAELDPEDMDSLPDPDQNFFVFGGFTPFVGAGQDLGGWSVVIALDKPRTDFGATAAIQPFEIGEVYEAIDAGLENLAVRDVQKTDAFFARGTDVRGDRDLLPDIYGRPAQHLSPRVAAQYLYLDDEKVRHYRTYRIVDWGGELALSYYIRCSCRGNTLFVETKRFILTPLETKYRAVDALVPTHPLEVVGSMIGGLVIGPVMAALSPLWAFAQISEKLGKLLSFHEDSRRRDMIENTPLFNYGAETSLRQALSSGAYGHYFQKMDGDLYSKLFEHEVLDSLVEFLNAHGVDTSELKERQTTILNNGVMVQGGDVNAESLAVGAGAKAVKKAKSMVGGGSPAMASAGRAE